MFLKPLKNLVNAQRPAEVTVHFREVVSNFSIALTKSIRQLFPDQLYLGGYLATIDTTQKPTCDSNRSCYMHIQTKERTSETGIGELSACYLRSPSEETAAGYWWPHLLCTVPQHLLHMRMGLTRGNTSKPASLKPFQCREGPCTSLFLPNSLSTHHRSGKCRVSGPQRLTTSLNISNKILTTQSNKTTKSKYTAKKLLKKEAREQKQSEEKVLKCHWERLKAHQYSFRHAAGGFEIRQFSLPKATGLDAALGPRLHCFPQAPSLHISGEILKIPEISCEFVFTLKGYSRLQCLVLALFCV